MRAAGSALVILLAVSRAGADEPMVTDRPDFTESSAAVPKGTVQIEAGGTYVEVEQSDETSLGELLVRWGIVKGLELRIGVGGFAWSDAPEGDASGFEAFGIGGIVLDDQTITGTLAQPFDGRGLFHRLACDALDVSRAHENLVSNQRVGDDENELNHRLDPHARKRSLCLLF